MNIRGSSGISCDEGANLVVSAYPQDPHCNAVIPMLVLDTEFLISRQLFFGTVITV